MSLPIVHNFSRPKNKSQTNEVYLKKRKKKKLKCFLAAICIANIPETGRKCLLGTNFSHSWCCTDYFIIVCVIRSINRRNMSSNAPGWLSDVLLNYRGIRYWIIGVNLMIWENIKQPDHFFFLKLIVIILEIPLITELHSVTVSVSNVRLWLVSLNKIQTLWHEQSFYLKKLNCYVQYIKKNHEFSPKTFLFAFQVHLIQSCYEKQENPHTARAFLYSIQQKTNKNILHHHHHHHCCQILKLNR